jgi:hypothetical protein
MSITGSGVSRTAAKRAKTSSTSRPWCHWAAPCGDVLVVTEHLQLRLGCALERTPEGVRQDGDVANAAGDRQPHGGDDAVDDIGKATVDEAALGRGLADGTGNARGEQGLEHRGRAQSAIPDEARPGIAVTGDHRGGLQRGRLQDDGRPQAREQRREPIAGDVEGMGRDPHRAREHVGARRRRRLDPGEAQGIAAGAVELQGSVCGGGEIAGDALGEAAGPEQQDVAFLHRLVPNTAPWESGVGRRIGAHFLARVSDE